MGSAPGSAEVPNLRNDDVCNRKTPSHSIRTGTGSLSITSESGRRSPFLRRRCDSSSSDPESDAYIDQILANLATVIIENGLDPAPLPDADTGFSDTILGITFHGSAHLFNGRFWRLSTIHRTGDTSFTVDGTKVRLTANIGVDAPTAHYDASAEFMGIGVSAGITANIADFGIYIDAEMDVASGGGLQLTNFAISHVGHIDIDVSGLRPLDWILELLVDFVDTFLKDWIVSLVEGPLKDLIQQILDDCVPNFPPAVNHI